MHIVKKDNIERTVSAAELNDFLKKGYVELGCSTSKNVRKVDTEAPRQLRNMSVKELKSLAETRGFKGATGLNKAQLIELLED